MGATSLVAGLSQPHRRAPTGDVQLDLLFPKAFGPWRIDDAMNSFVRPANLTAYRIYDQVLERTYVSAEGLRVMLSVAYGSTQSEGLELHRPELCYRFNGFAIRGVRPEEIHTPRGQFVVNRLVAERPGRPEAITYWVTLAGQLVPDANAFRLQSLRYAVRRTIVDGLLVRVSTIDPMPGRAYRIHDSFVSALQGSLSPSARGIVFGNEEAPRLL